MTATTTRRAVPGRCTGCGQRTVRGALEDDSIVEVDIRDLNAADELRAWASGRRTVAVRWRHAIELRSRSDRDRRLKPAGYAEGRIWVEHDCPATHPTGAPL